MPSVDLKQRKIPRTKITKKKQQKVKTSQNLDDAGSEVFLVVFQKQ